MTDPQALTIGHRIQEHLAASAVWMRITISAVLALLLLPAFAAAQITPCSYSPSSVSFPATGGTALIQISEGNGGSTTCVPGFASQNLPGGQATDCGPAGQVISCSAAANGSCSEIVDVWEAANGATITLTIAPGGTGCATSPPLPSASPINGLGPAGSPSNPQGCACDPVSTGNGNYFYTHTDLAVANYIPDLALAFQRSYNSQDVIGSAVGTKWTHNFNIWLGSATENGLPATVVKWGDGHNDIYFQQNGVYTPLAPATGTLTVAPSTGNFLLTRKDGAQFSFAPNGLLSSIQNRNGLAITLTRDANGNLLTVSDGQQQLSFAYGSNLLLSSVSDLTGRTVSYKYDSIGNLISETDPAGNVTQYAYDSLSNLLSVTLPNGKLQMQNTYVGNSQVASQTNADGYTTTFAYSGFPLQQTTITDPLGNVTIHNYGGATLASLTSLNSIVDPLGNTTSFTYDKNNDITSITDPKGNTGSYTYDSVGNILTRTDPLGNTYTYTYNSFGEPLTVEDPKRTTTSLSYDSSGNLLTVSDGLGNTTALTYDGSGHLTNVMDPRGNATSFIYGTCSFCVSTVTDATGQTTSFAYDALNRPISATDANKHTSSMSYDALSRITAFVNALGAQTVFAYDSLGHVTAVTDASAHATSYSYDPVGNVILVTDAMGHDTSFTYDQNNKLKSSINGNNHVTSYSYDAASRMIKVTSPKKENTSYVYNTNGTIASSTDGNGAKTRFSYDADNRLRKIAYSDGSSVAYTFDSDGNRLSMSDAHGTTSYAYDALDRIVSIAFPGGKNLQYAYDSVGNKASLQYPDGQTISYAYDPDNRLKQVMDSQSRVSSYAYDPAGNLADIAYPNGVNELFSYDPANRLTQIVDQSGNSPFRTLVYGLDVAGNRTTLSDNGLVTKFTYNAINELKSSTTSKAKMTWDYNGVGGRISQVTPSGTTNYTYDAAERMLTAGSSTFTYDKNGNRLTEVASSGTTAFSYDLSNRLVSVLSPAGTSSFGYDGDGNRITQTVPSGTYSYVNDPNGPLALVVNENGPDGAIDYDYGLGILESSGPTFNYFYNLDGLGSVTNLTDTSGRMQQALSYDAWGNSLSETGGVGTKNKFKFTGQALDPGTGLYFMRARYYEPAAGRFLSKDPIVGVTADPNTLHHYMYARNNPNRFVDPTGKFAWVPLLAACAASEVCTIAAASAATAGLDWLTCQESGMPPDPNNPFDLLVGIESKLIPENPYCHDFPEPPPPPCPVNPVPPATSPSSSAPGPTPAPLPAPVSPTMGSGPS
jgi:RHS repeat-associated protein